MHHALKGTLKYWKSAQKKILCGQTVNLIKHNTGLEVQDVRMFTGQMKDVVE